jgi:hypothetical protein
LPIHSAAIAAFETFWSAGLPRFTDDVLESAGLRLDEGLNRKSGGKTAALQSGKIITQLCYHGAAVEQGEP